MERDYVISPGMLRRYGEYLEQAERSAGTVRKYLRDVRVFAASAPGAAVGKETVIRWKERLAEHYAVSTVNSMLAALNSFFDFMGWQELRVRPLKRQRRIFCARERELTKEEYLRLLRTAEEAGNRRLCLIMQTLCATGIRVSELRYITAEAVRDGRAEVRSKGKQRPVLLADKLRRALAAYLRERGIRSGSVFVTGGGRPVDRSNIWSEMKRLCARAGIDPRKVFPHNLRHLFARTFYALQKDLAKLADVLGHANIETTRVYIMESGAEHARQVARLGLVL